MALSAEQEAALKEIADKAISEKAEILARDQAISDAQAAAVRKVSRDAYEAEIRAKHETDIQASLAEWDKSH
jgi:hypothetical protein